ncbi:MAG TPA: ThiF family adenylyltransferase [Sphingomicrobium sp.]|nr:ThiF family adenylyltransferase [Sphingomicrobium sp.]
MSQQLINRSPDLKRLRDEGYTVDILDGHLLVHNIPYVNAAKQVKVGTLVSTLCLAGDVTRPPDTHVAFFIGEAPCTAAGVPIQQIKHSDSPNQLSEYIRADRSFSNKPREGYRDYYDKMSTYASILSGPAEAIDPTVTAKSFIAIKSDTPESVFNYVDTASSRAGIHSVSYKLTDEVIAMIGLGGTGAYGLDFVAKTPVSEIRLFDHDKMFQHNAFRSPGAATLAALQAAPSKVEYLREIYSAMHRNIVAHPVHITPATAHLLDGVTFAFVCIDGGEGKEAVIRALEDRNIPFIDVGIGVQLVDGRLLGVVRTTTSKPGMRGHLRTRVSFGDSDAGNEYASNIQIAELNALNAVQAVIKWKKMRGIYVDLEGEHHSTFTIDGNSIINDDLESPPDAA